MIMQACTLSKSLTFARGVNQLVRDFPEVGVLLQKEGVAVSWLTGDGAQLPTVRHADADAEDVDALFPGQFSLGDSLLRIHIGQAVCYYDGWKRNEATTLSDLKSNLSQWQVLDMNLQVQS